MAKADLYVTRALTGHTHYGSPYESFDNCGTCDGALCESCKERWWLEEFDDLDLIKWDHESFTTKEEAYARKEELEKLAESM